MRAAVLLLAIVCPRAAFAYGEPDEDGLPNRKERLLQVFTNQARQAPHEWPGWDTSLATPDPRPPLAHQPGLSIAARFHADDMRDHGCFTHESCDGTTFEARVSRYFSGAGAGENLYSAFGDDSERAAITGWFNSEGHRINMLTHEWTNLGAGWSEKASQIWFVQDFGLIINAKIPSIPAASWEPTGKQTLLHANFWDEDGFPPISLVASVDNRDVPLEHEVGPVGNETYTARIDTPDECVELFFTAVDHDGDEDRYPTEGALLFGPGCESEYTSEVTPRMDRIIVDADRRGCTAMDVHEGGLLPLLALLGLIALRRR